MKIIVAIILLISGSNSLSGQQDYQISSTLYVLAFSGLNLRMGPSLDTDSKYLIKYGEPLKVKAKQLKKDTIDFRQGNWIKVDYLGDEGYVFDGYLTQREVPTLEEVKQGDLVHYINRVEKDENHDGNSIQYKLPNKLGYDADIIELKELSKDVVSRYIISYECRTEQFIFKNRRPNELLSLLALFYDNMAINTTKLSTELKQQPSLEKWSVYIPGYGIGFDYHTQQDGLSLISFFELTSFYLIQKHPMPTK